jgi:isoleucyl-tRNA synthetase
MKPDEEPAYLIVWTTTPWTLPANTAVALNPTETYVWAKFRPPAGSANGGKIETFLVADKLKERLSRETGWELIHEDSRPAFLAANRYNHQTKKVDLVTRHPFMERDSPVVLADFVTMDSGTGAVHIAPGHGADDYVVGRREGLPLLSPVDDHGRFTEEAGLPNVTGKYVFDANIDIINVLRDRGMLVSEEKYHHSYPYCWRSKTPIIFRAVEQFFIRIDDLRSRALEAIHGEVKWIPAWGENRIAGTVESRPDWVISRQRSWGVPLPVFYSATGETILDPRHIRTLADLVSQRGSNIWFELNDAELAREIGLPEGTTHRNDTIDVWIDSGVSHKAVCATRPELHDPADMYLEATDQHRGWFQSSLMTSIALNNRAPYKICVTHGFVVDVDGKKISKSGTYDKPMDAGHFVGRHGADLVRLWASSINYTDDVPFSEEMFTRLGDTYRRIRNTLRILLGNLYDFEAGGANLPNESFTLVDRWILERLDQVIGDCRTAYESFEFHKVYHVINQFCAVDLSSLYVDITKDRMYCDAPDSPRRRATQAAMRTIFDGLCRLLGPILVFTADEAWQHAKASGSIHLQEFPQQEQRGDKVTGQVTELLRLRGVIGQAIEKARQDKLIGNALEAAVVLNSNSSVTSEIDKDELEEFFILSDLTVQPATEASAVVTQTAHKKCARCWRHRPSVGTSAAYPDLCDRCEAVVRRATN